MVEQEEQNELEFPKDYLQFDTQNLLKDYNSLTKDIKEAYNHGKLVELPELKNPIDHIFFIGMGGSAIGGDLMRLYLEEKEFTIPITTLRSYNIPNTVTSNSLVFAISYSGNTEETISAYRQALKKTKHVIVLSTGGHIQEVSKINRNPFLEIPKGYQPRTAAISYLFFPVLKILERYQIIPSVEGDVQRLVTELQKPDFKTIGVTISEKLFHTIPLIYASEKFYPIAYRFKTQINENAKIHAFASRYSELNHNEIVGYTNLIADYQIITFRFDEDHRRIQKRMDITKELTNKAGIATTEIKLSGDHFLTKLFSGIIIGDLAAFYLALRYKTDPSPVKIIEDLKEKMGPFI